MMLEGRLRCIDSRRADATINSLRLETYDDAAFYYGLIFGGRKCLHATSQKRALSHAISLAVNYRLFSHGDVSYRFNGKMITSC